MPDKILQVAIIGGGPAGLMAAQTLLGHGIKVTIFEQKPAIARKFLMAGRGGLNLTHSEPIEKFISSFGNAASWLEPYIRSFSPTDTQNWADKLGAETFIGSSKRVFPKAMKASPLLRAWLTMLGEQGLDVRLRHHWQGWDNDGQLIFATPHGQQLVDADATILSLGGASWPRLGSRGDWVPILGDKELEVTPLTPSNNGIICNWNEYILRHAGSPLKNLVVGLDDTSHKGEVVLTKTGLEGGPIYALSSNLRSALADNKPVSLEIDLASGSDLESLVDRLANVPAKQSFTNRLRRAARLSAAKIALYREFSGNVDAGDHRAVASKIKALPVPVYSMAGFERAISTAGGLSRQALNEDLSVKAMPGLFACGEMLDRDAPTGGYLLQGCFSTGHAAGSSALAYLQR